MDDNSTLSSNPWFITNKRHNFMHKGPTTLIGGTLATLNMCFFIFFSKIFLKSFQHIILKDLKKNSKLFIYYYYKFYTNVFSKLSIKKIQITFFCVFIIGLSFKKTSYITCKMFLCIFYSLNWFSFFEICIRI